MPHRLLLVLIGAALTAAACAAGSSASDDGTTVLQTTSTIVEEPQPVTLRVALVALDDLDPAGQRLTSRSAMIAMDLLLDGLTSIDAETGEVVPGLAETWSVSDNGLRWRFDLAAPDSPDGRPPATAADVKWSLERIARRGQQSIPGSSLGPVLGYQDASGATGLVGLRGVKAIGADRVVVRLTEPFAALPALLAHPTFGVLPEGADEVPVGDQADRSSSAFMVESSSEFGLILEAHDRFAGSLDRVEIVWVGDEVAAAAAVESGIADLAPVGDEIGTFPDEVVAAYGQTDFYGLNLAHPVLRDAGFRRAIVQAIDRSPLVGSRATDPLAGLIPEPDRDVCGDPCGFDPDVAAQTVEFVFGAEEVPTIGIDIPGGSVEEIAMAQSIAADLRAAGIPTELRPLTLPALEERITDGEHMVFRFGWVGAYDDDQAWLDSLFRSDGPDNVFNLADPAIDALIAELSATTDPDERDRLAEELEREVLTEYVVIPVESRRQVMAHAAGVDGIVLRPDGTFDVELVTID